MQEELKYLCNTNTWTSVERPEDENTIPGKWVSKVKTKADGSLEKFKEHHLAKGFKQNEGTDLTEIIGPTRKPENFRLILSLAAKKISY